MPLSQGAGVIATLHYICTCPFAQVQIFLPIGKCNNNVPHQGGMSSIYFNSRPLFSQYPIPPAHSHFPHIGIKTPPISPCFFLHFLLFTVFAPQFSFCQNAQHFPHFSRPFLRNRLFPTLSALGILSIFSFSSFRRKIPVPFLIFRSTFSARPAFHFFFSSIFHFAMVIFAFMLYNIGRFERE